MGDLAVGLAPDLGAGGGVVRLGVRLVCVLVWAVCAGDLVDETFSHRVIRLWIFGRHRNRTHHDFGAVGTQQIDLLWRDLVGHDEDTFVTPLAGDDGQADTGIARGRFNDGATRLQQSLGLGVVDHPQRGSILGATAGVREFKLGDDGALGVLDHCIESDHRRVPDEVYR